MKAIKIGWRKYRVRFDDRVLDPDDPFESVYGTISPGQQLICIDRTEPVEQQGTTLLHEAIHAIDQEYSLFLEEITVKQLARALYTVFRDNPHLPQEIWR